MIIYLIIGAIAGWLAGRLMKGKYLGLIGNMVVGIIGAVIGGFVFSFLDVSADGFIGSIIKTTLGAIMLLYVIGLIKKA